MVGTDTDSLEEGAPLDAAGTYEISLLRPPVNIERSVVEPC